MREDQKETGKLFEHGHGLGTVTEAMVHQRAREIALINGRDEKNVIEADFEQARRELTGEEGLVPEPTAAETMTEDQRWEPMLESRGHEAPTSSAPDEQRFAEELVEEGVEEAEHEQMTGAERENRKREKEES
jgi:hypothetical protein